MELDRILEDMLDSIKESEASKKKLIHSMSELMDRIKTSEIIRLCVLQFMNKAAALEGDNDYQNGYIAAAADLCEMIDIARGVKKDDRRGEDADCDSETNEGQE